MKRPRGRPNQGRSKTIKKRAVYVYLPTEKMAEEWRREATRWKVPLSTFVVEVVDDAIRKGRMKPTPRKVLERDLKVSLAKKEALSKLVGSLRAIVREQGRTVAEYRERLEKPSANLEDPLYLVGPLAEVLREHKVMPMEEAAAALDIGPDDTEALSNLRIAANALAIAGIIRKGIHEWRWVGWS